MLFSSPYCPAKLHFSTVPFMGVRSNPKGLYQKARAGLIPQFTGIDSPYEPPLNPEISIPTEQFTVKDAVERIYQVIKNS